MRFTFILKLISAILLIALCTVALPRQPNNKEVWNPDNGNGTYRNPIIAADYSDPDVIRVGDDFYLTASSFNCAPGLPILHSKDLVNWRIVAHVFEQQSPADVFKKPQHGNGVWAPSIRYHKGLFYIFYGDPDFGVYMTKASNPAGPWTTPLLIKEAKGWIDTCPLWDDDGNAYLVHAWANSRSGIKSILTINRMTPDGTKLLDEGRMVFDGRQHHPTIEGPKLYKRNGYYYIFAPAGGVTSGWQTVLRSRNIFGPYEDRIVLDQGKTSINGPHQGGWVETQSGESWFVHFQDRAAYGRIVHLQPMNWIDDWPVIGLDADGDGKGEPVSVHKKPNVGRVFPVQVPQTTDEFNTANLGLQWQWHANWKSEWWSNEKKGWVRLRAQRPPVNNLWSAPNLLLQKLPAFSFSTTTKIDGRGLKDGDRIGLLIMGMDYSYLAVVRRGSELYLEKIVCKNAPSGTSESAETSIKVNPGVTYLRVTVSEGASCRFSYSQNGREFHAIGEEFNAKPGRWIGAKVGLFAIGNGSGYADVDWFRFEK